MFKQHLLYNHKVDELLQGCSLHEFTEIAQRIPFNAQFWLSYHSVGKQLLFFFSTTINPRATSTERKCGTRVRFAVHLIHDYLIFLRLLLEKVVQSS